MNYEITQCFVWKELLRRLKVCKQLICLILLPPNLNWQILQNSAQWSYVTFFIFNQNYITNRNYYKEQSFWSTLVTLHRYSSRCLMKGFHGGERWIIKGLLTSYLKNCDRIKNSEWFFLKSPCTMIQLASSI